MSGATEYFDAPVLINVGEFMRSPGSHFYIPAYQRDISWSTDNVVRLFDDVVSGVGALKGDKQSISFIGAMVCFHDQKYNTIDPKIRTDVPSRVLTVVDGQQRLVALTMVAGVLHDYLRVNLNHLPDGDWLKDQVIETNGQLEEILEEKRRIGETDFYPRMIRAYADQWAKETKHATYTSPLSSFVAYYHAFRGGHPEAQYHHKIPRGSGADHNRFGKVLKQISSQIKGIIAEKEGLENLLPPVAEMAESKGIMSALFRVDGIPSESSFDSNDEESCKIFRAVVLARYILERIHFVVVTVKGKEDYAFDIFESLNTTGQILTAFETFVPEVIKYVRPENYGDSLSKFHMDAVKDYLGGFAAGDQKIRVTRDIIVFFALAETGDKVSRMLREQRGYLRGKYESAGDSMQAREGFTQHLMHATAVHQHLWVGKKNLPDYPNSPFRGFSANTSGLIAEANFALSFLGEAKNDIVRAVITRFYERVLLADDNEKEACVVNFCKAVKAIAAFFTLWRASRNDTDGVDSRYRSLLEGNAKAGIAPLHRRSGTVPMAEDLQKSLVYFLKEDGGNLPRKITSMEKWVEHVTKNPVYTIRGVSVLLVLMAFHNAIPDEEKPGFLKPALEGVSPVISSDAWFRKGHETVEHVIPQSHAVALGVDAEVLNYLGNLTLVPRQVNSILSSRPWEQKRLIFKALAAETEEERNDTLQRANFLSEDAQKALSESAHLPLVKAMPLAFGDVVDAESAQRVIAERGENLAEMAWRNLSDWINFDAE